MQGQPERPDLATGDVAVCGPSCTSAHPAAVGPRVCFTAPLDSLAQLEELLRALHRHPRVSTLVLCGDGPDPYGEALLALWREGLDASGRIPGSRGVLSPELDAASVDALRRSIRMEDSRGRPSSEVARHIAGLPVHSPDREGRQLAAPRPRERTVFHSRRTTFPIFSTSAGDAWLQLLNLVLRIGLERRAADGARIAEALNAAVTIEPAAIDEDPPGCFDCNQDDLVRYCRRVEADLCPDETRIDALCTQLREWGVANSDLTWSAGRGGGRGTNGTPESVFATFNVVDEKLFASFVLRSLDVYTDWPIQATALLRLLRRVAERLGRPPGSAVFLIQSVRLDDRDWNRASDVLAERFKRPLPLQIDPAGIFLFGNDGGKARAMLLDHDAGTIFWEEAFSDPEDLSWYIVDVMPWLLPQHIRYVGQECASLMRAIKEGECYTQG
jgi:hypothetical protein